MHCNFINLFPFKSPFALPQLPDTLFFFQLSVFLQQVCTHSVPVVLPPTMPEVTDHGNIINDQVFGPSILEDASHTGTDSLIKENDALSFITSEIVQALNQKNVKIQLEAVQKMCDMSAEAPNRFAKLINAEIVSQLVEFLHRSPRIDFWLEVKSSWLLTVVSIRHAQTLIDCGAVPILKRRISKTLNLVTEDDIIGSVVTLGNIAGASPQCRDFLLNRNVLPLLLK